jgi:hypothetical protein
MFDASSPKHLAMLHNTSPSVWKTSRGANLERQGNNQPSLIKSPQLMSTMASTGNLSLKGASTFGSGNMFSRPPLSNFGMTIYQHDKGGSSSVAFPGAAPPTSSLMSGRSMSAPGLSHQSLFDEPPDFLKIDYSLPGNDRINVNKDCVNTQRMKNRQRHRGKQLYSGSASHWQSTSSNHFQNWTVEK